MCVYLCVCTCTYMWMCAGIIYVNICMCVMTIYNSGNRLSMCLAQDFSATQTVGNKFCGLGVTEAVLKAPRVNKDGFTFAVHFFL